MRYLLLSVLVVCVIGVMVVPDAYSDTHYNINEGTIVDYKVDSTCKIETSEYSKETGIFKNEKLFTGTREVLKFTDYQRKIITYRNGSEISKDIIKSDDFIKIREKMFNMNKILLDSIISILPAKFKT